MREEAKIAFYSITRCGYYERNGSKPAFGEVCDSLDDLRDWVKRDNRPLVETCTYKCDEASSEMRTFCYDIQKSVKGNFLLTTWNETPSSAGGVHAVRGSEPVGCAKVVSSPLEAGAIPGYATYFWFVPSKRVFATVRFQHPVNGQAALVKYLREYLAKLSKYVRFADDDGDEVNTILGYSDNEALPENQMYARFDTTLFRKPGGVELLRKKRPMIRKLIRKNSLSVDVPSETSMIRHLLQAAGLAEPERLTQEIHYKQEIKYNPNENELEQIITQWERRHDTKWDDIGFKLQGEQETHWLSHAFAKTKFEIDVTRQNEEVISAISILEGLDNLQDTLFMLLTKPQAE